MNAPSLLGPGLQQAVAIFVVGLSVLMVAVHSGMFALAARSSGMGRRAQLGAPLVVALLLATWFGWAESSALARAAAPPAITGDPRAAIPIVLTMLGFIAVGSLALIGSKTLRTVNAAMPPWWLIAVQTYRVAGAMFIWPFLTSGTLPAGFALPAGIGDFLVGAAAPFVAAAVAANRPGARTWAVAWNWFGLIDLIAAPTAAVLSQAQVVSSYPLALVPLFLGPPLGILTHIYSLRNLAVTRDRSVIDDVVEVRAATV